MKGNTGEATRYLPPQQTVAVEVASNKRAGKSAAVIVALATTLTILLMAGPLASGASAKGNGISANPCANTVSTGGGTCNATPVNLSSQEKSILAQKTALAQQYAQVRAGTFDRATFQRNWEAFVGQHGGPVTGSFQAQRSLIQPRCVEPCYNSNSVGINQSPQANWYYCGPAPRTRCSHTRCHITVCQLPARTEKAYPRPVLLDRATCRRTRMVARTGVRLSWDPR